MIQNYLAILFSVGIAAVCPIAALLEQAGAEYKIPFLRNLANFFGFYGLGCIAVAVGGLSYLGLQCSC